MISQWFQENSNNKIQYLRINDENIKITPFIKMINDKYQNYFEDKSANFINKTIKYLIQRCRKRNDAKKLWKFKMFFRRLFFHDNVQLNQLYRDQISLKTSNFKLLLENSIRSVFARWKILWSTLRRTTRILTSFKEFHYTNDEKFLMRYEVIVRFRYLLSFER
jgi:hypothetical protein